MTTRYHYPAERRVPVEGKMKLQRLYSRYWKLVGIVGGLAACLGTAILVSSAPAAAASAASPAWHSVAIKQPPASGAFAILQAVSCSAPGSCVAGGNDNSSAAVIATERQSTWSAAQPVPLPAGTQQSSVTGVSCSREVCTAVGSLLSSSGNQGSFVTTEEGGRWSVPALIRPPANAAPANSGAFLNSVSCTSAGNCVAVGSYSKAGRAFSELFMVATQTAGRWDRATELALPANARGGSATLASVSCGAAGSCVAVGSYSTSKALVPLTITKSHGRWGAAHEVAVPRNGTGSRLEQAEFGSVTCTHRLCLAVGTYSVTRTKLESMAAIERRGRWGRPVEVPTAVLKHTRLRLLLESVSCSSSFCLAIGFSPDRPIRVQVALTYTGGKWGHAALVSPPANALSGSGAVTDLYQVTCSSRGACTAGGAYLTKANQLQLMVASRS
jgi:hypothetical protein